MRYDRPAVTAGRIPAQLFESIHLKEILKEIERCRELSIDLAIATVVDQVIENGIAPRWSPSGDLRRTRLAQSSQSQLMEQPSVPFQADALRRRSSAQPSA